MHNDMHTQAVFLQLTIGLGLHPAKGCRYIATIWFHSSVHVFDTWSWCWQTNVLLPLVLWYCWLESGRASWE